MPRVPPGLVQHQAIPPAHRKPHRSSLENSRSIEDLLFLNRWTRWDFDASGRSLSLVLISDCPVILQRGKFLEFIPGLRSSAYKDSGRNRSSDFRTEDPKRARYYSLARVSFTTHLEK